MDKDSISNKNNLPSDHYAEKEIGPMIHIPREDDFHTLIDQVEAASHPDDGDLEEADAEILLEEISNRDYATFNESGLQYDWEAGKALLEVFDSMGPRKIRKYPALRLFQEVLRNHYAPNRAASDDRDSLAKL